MLATLVGGPGAYAVSNPKPEPDLIVSHGRLDQVGGGHWTLRGHPDAFTWRHRTENQGRKISPKSRTALEFVNRTGRATVLDRLRVPALAHGESKASGRTFTENFDETFDYGTYTPRVCADVGDKITERREGNNCKELGHAFYVVPFAFRGTVTGVAALDAGLLPGVILTWRGTVTAELEGIANADDGTFDYVFSGGSLTYTVTGTDGAGCIWSGTGTYQPSTWRAELNTRFGDGFRGSHYRFQAGVAPTYNFPATITCPDGHGPTPAAIMPTQFGIGRWLDTGFTPFDLPLDDPGEDRLSGQNTDTLRSAGATSYTWDLQARATG